MINVAYKVAMVLRNSGGVLSLCDEFYAGVKHYK